MSVIMDNMFESDDDDDFFTPSVAHFSDMFSTVHQQVRKEAASSSFQPKLIRTNRSEITDAKPSSKMSKKTKLDDAPKTTSSSSLFPNTSKTDGKAETPRTDDFQDLIAQANKIIVAVPAPAKSSSSQSGIVKSETTSKRKVPSRTRAASKAKAPSKTSSKTKVPSSTAQMPQLTSSIADIVNSSIASVVAAAVSAQPKRRGRQPKPKPQPQSFLDSFSASDLGTVVTNGRRRSTRKEKKRVPDVVTLTVPSSDEEEVVEGVDISLNLTHNENETLINEVQEIPDDVCTVRIRWKDEILRFTAPNGTKLSKIRMDMADRVSVRADNLVVLEGEGREVPDNTLVQNLPLEILDVFERKPIPVTNNNNPRKMDPDCIQVKVQGCGGYRERLTVIIKKTTHIKQLIDDFVDKYGYHDKHFKLVFDGDTVDLSETAESLDLDGGEMFDIVEVK